MYRPKEQSMAWESFRPCSLASICSEIRALPSNDRSWIDCCTSRDIQRTAATSSISSRQRKPWTWPPSLPASNAVWREGLATVQNTPELLSEVLWQAVPKFPQQVPDVIIFTQQCLPVRYSMLEVGSQINFLPREVQFLSILVFRHGTHLSCLSRSFMAETMRELGGGGNVSIHNPWQVHNTTFPPSLKLVAKRTGSTTGL